MVRLAWAFWIGITVVACGESSDDGGSSGSAGTGGASGADGGGSAGQGGSSGATGGSAGSSGSDGGGSAGQSGSAGTGGSSGSGGTGGASGSGGTGGASGSGGTGGSAGTGNGRVCGGIIGLTCEENEWCDYPSNCGSGDVQGVCTPKPDACTRDCPGVCGCDGNSYCNACVAQQAGIDVAPPAVCR